MEAMAERIGTFLDTPSMIFASLSSFPKVFRSARVSFPFGKMDRIRSQYMFQRVADDTQYQHEMDHTKGIII